MTSNNDERNPMDASKLARQYADRAAQLAEQADEKNAHGSSEKHLVAGIATVASLHADVARAYAAVAQIYKGN